MATLLTQVDRVRVNYEQVFVYVMNVSFNGIQGNIQSAQVKVFVPEEVNYTIGDVQEPIKSVTYEEVSGGSNIIFDFGEIVDLGISARLSFGCQFKLVATSGMVFECIPKLWINGSVYMSSQVDNVTLVVIPQFEIESYVLLPQVNPAPGGEIYYMLELENFGDKGAEIEDVVITCPMPTGLTLDTTFEIIGKDTSQAPFQDTSADGIEGVITNNQLVLDIPSYRGTNYQVIYRVLLDSDLVVGVEVVTTINWSIKEEEQSPDIHTVTLANPNYSATISKYGPDYTMPGEYTKSKEAIVYVSSSNDTALLNKWQWRGCNTFISDCRLLIYTAIFNKI